MQVAEAAPVALDPALLETYQPADLQRATWWRKRLGRVLRTREWPDHAWVRQLGRDTWYSGGW